MPVHAFCKHSIGAAAEHGAILGRYASDVPVCNTRGTSCSASAQQPCPLLLLLKKPKSCMMASTAVGRSGSVALCSSGQVRAQGSSCIGPTCCMQQRRDAALATSSAKRIGGLPKASLSRHFLCAGCRTKPFDQHSKAQLSTADSRCSHKRESAIYRLLAHTRVDHHATTCFALSKTCLCCTSAAGLLVDVPAAQRRAAVCHSFGRTSCEQTWAGASALARACS